MTTTNPGVGDNSRFEFFLDDRLEENFKTVMIPAKETAGCPTSNNV